jgi:hypothetical protein
LATYAQDFWPPTYTGQGIQAGLFIIRFSLAGGQKGDLDILRTDLSATTKVIPIPAEALSRHLQ